MTDEKILFLGDSITEYWLQEGRRTWERLFARRVTNLGRAGATTWDLLAQVRREGFDMSTYENVLILIGANDLLCGVEPTEIVRNIVEVVRVVGEKLPDARVILHAVLPMALGEPLYEDSRVCLNGLLKRFAEDGQHTILDASALFFSGPHTVSAGMLSDGVHLTSNAYRVWGDFLVARLPRVSAFDRVSLSS